MKRIIFIILFWTTATLSQVVGPGFVNYVTSAPSGSCSQNAQQQNVMGLGTIYTCQSGTWAQVTGGGGGSGLTGTLTSGKIPVATGAHTLGDGSLTDSGGNVALLGNHELNIPGLVGAGTSVDGYLNVGPAISALSAYAQTVALPANEFSLNVTTNEPDLTHNFAAAQFVLDGATTFSNVINVFAAVKLAGNDTSGVNLEGNFTEANINLNGHTTASGITATQSNAQLNGTGTLGGNNIAVQAIPVFQNGTQSAISSWGVDSFAFNLPVVTTVTLSGTAAAFHATTPPLNGGTVTVPINAQFLAEANSGTTPTLNALFYGKDQGSNAIDWGLYLAGASKSHLGSGGIQFPGSSTGAATIVAPAAAGTPTLTLPTSTGTLALTSQLGTAWDAITAPAGNLALTMGANTSTFNTTTAGATFFNWKNTTAAVVGTSQGSPLLNLCGRAFHGSADVEDCMTLSELPGNGNDAAISFNIGHTGTSTGIPALKMPNNGSITTPPYGFTNCSGCGLLASGTSAIALAAGAVDFLSLGTTGTQIRSDRTYGWASGTTPFAVANDTGISRDSAGVVDIGTGAQGSTAGNLQLNLVKKYNGVTTVSGGVPAEFATVDLTAQSAAIAATTIYATTFTGMYRVCFSADITTAGTSSTLGGSGGYQILFTSPTDSVVKTTVVDSTTSSTGNTTGTAVEGCKTVYAKTGTNIQHQFGYTSSGTTMVYELHAKVESL